MWTDMSEIVRPTRDGIHGREYISTEIDIGGKPKFLKEGDPLSEPHTAPASIPLLFDCRHEEIATILSETVHALHSFTFIPFKMVEKDNLKGARVVPILQRNDIEHFQNLNSESLMVEMAEWEPDLYSRLRKNFPETIVALRIPFETDLTPFYHAGIRVFHLIANFEGRSTSGAFILDLIRDTHTKLIREGIREEITLIGSGGIIAAEHQAKAIICGLDAVAIDTVIDVALQARNSQFPKNMTPQWARQRLLNIASAWHAQLLEIMGAMGLREVRRLRGELGRALFQNELENDAFKGIHGYEQR
jgi:hypothetical protein